PAVIFGKEDILINNIAWIIRKLPVFGVFGKGDYKLQPIYVEDMAALIVNQITQSQDVTINAIGPETFTYKELVSEIMRIIDVKKKIIHVDPFIGYLVGRLLSFFKNDVTITRAEIKGLMSDLLFVNDSPIGKTKLSEWAMENKNGLGKEYANELSRR
ncbi:MAG: epimerase, partial [Bacteroidetes bacterium]|nr:epimerase [Bacteroidota bacterium]